MGRRLTVGPVARIEGHAEVTVALGDCAASGNVTGLRDAAGGAAAIRRTAWIGEGPRDPALPALLDPVLPLAAVVPVDAFLPGCPPPAAAIGRALTALVGPAPGGR